MPPLLPTHTALPRVCGWGLAGEWQAGRVAVGAEGGMELPGRGRGAACHPSGPAPPALAQVAAAVSAHTLHLPCLPQVCLACASAFVVLKESQENVDPFVFSSIRFIIAAAVFSPFVRNALREERVVKAGVEIGAWAAGGYLTQSIGMLTADASRGAFLSGFTVVVVPLMAGMFGTAKLKRSTWGAVLAALVGISLLEDSGAPASWGDFWSFMSAVLFGAQVTPPAVWKCCCLGVHAGCTGWPDAWHPWLRPSPPRPHMPRQRCLWLPELLGAPSCRRAATALPAPAVPPAALPAVLFRGTALAPLKLARPSHPPALRYTVLSTGASSWAPSRPSPCCLCL